MKSLIGLFYVAVVLPVYVAVFAALTGVLFEILKHSFEAGVEFGNNLFGIL